MAAANLKDGDAALLADLQFDLSTFSVSGNSIALPSRNGAGDETGIAPQVAFSLGGHYSQPIVNFDRQPLVQFLTQRALEREQERVEAMQAKPDGKAAPAPPA